MLLWMILHTEKLYLLGMYSVLKSGMSITIIRTKANEQVAFCGPTLLMPLQTVWRHSVVNCLTICSYIAKISYLEINYRNFGALCRPRPESEIHRYRNRHRKSIFYRRRYRYRHRYTLQSTDYRVYPTVT